MIDLRITTTHGDVAGLPSNALGTLQSHLNGQLLFPGESDYDQARRVWNQMIDKRPAMIVRCWAVDDVRRSVDFARSHDLLMAVRGGGHGVAGNAVCDGGMVIDLSSMNSVTVDAQSRTARAAGGSTWAEFDRATQVHGLATTGGIYPTTGVAGLTLGGGIGWLMGKHGLTIDNLLSVELVTADGDLVAASDIENPELFWGLRGGGGNFGIATAFDFRVHPVGTLYGGWLLWPWGQARDALRHYREFTAGIPDELIAYANVANAPTGDRVALSMVCYNGPAEDGERVLRPFRKFGTPILDTVGPVSYAEVQGWLENAVPDRSPHRSYWKASFSPDLSDNVIDAMMTGFAETPSPKSTVAVELISGLASRIPSEATAFNSRRQRYSVLVAGIWADAVDDDRNIQWTRETWASIHGFASDSVYVNYIGEGEDRLLAAYGPDKYERLVALKRRYDPTNLFRLNQNINPG